MEMFTHENIDLKEIETMETIIKLSLKT
jgi:hypothetical protein